jgi:hypothetical protein
MEAPSRRPLAVSPAVQGLALTRASRPNVPVCPASGERRSPLWKRGAGGILIRIIRKIPLNPPFSKGEAHPLPSMRFLTASEWAGRLLPPVKETENEPPRHRAHRGDLNGLDQARPEESVHLNRGPDDFTHVREDETTKGTKLTKKEDQ